MLTRELFLSLLISTNVIFIMMMLLALAKLENKEHKSHFFFLNVNIILYNNFVLLYFAPDIPLQHREIFGYFSFYFSTFTAVSFGWFAVYLSEQNKVKSNTLFKFFQFLWLIMILLLLGNTIYKGVDVIEGKIISLYGLIHPIYLATYISYGIYILITIRKGYKKYTDDVRRPFLYLVYSFMMIVWFGVVLTNGVIPFLRNGDASTSVLAPFQFLILNLTILVLLLNRMVISRYYVYLFAPSQDMVAEKLKRLPRDKRNIIEDIIRKF